MEKDTATNLVTDDEADSKSLDKRFDRSFTPFLNICFCYFFCSYKLEVDY